MQPTRLPLTAALAALLVLLAACQGARLGPRLPQQGADAARRRGTAHGGLLGLSRHRGERATNFVETLELTDAELEILRRERALRNPATWPRRGPPTCAEAAMEAARNGQGSNDPLKQKRPGGICLPVGKLLKLLEPSLEK